MLPLRPLCLCGDKLSCLLQSSAPSPRSLRLCGDKLFPALLIVDPILNQANALTPIPLNLYRTALIATFVFLTILHAPELFEVARPQLAFAATALFAVAAFTINEFFAGALTSATANAYGQMLYWVLAWPLIALAARTPAARRRLMTAVIIQGVLLALPIWADTVRRIFLGIHNPAAPYANQGVEASFGYFKSAKTVAPILVCATMCALYRSMWGHASACPHNKIEKSRKYLLLSLFFSLAILQTYNRSAQLSLAVALAVFFSVPPLRPLRLCGAKLFFLFPLLFWNPRWSETTGSGRSALWSQAWETFKNSDSWLLGLGYTRMLDVSGRGIHMHSDVFDMMVTGGLVGLALLALRYWTMWQAHVGPRVSLLLAPGSSLLGPSPLASALLAAYCTASLTTGHLWATDLNLTYVAASAAVRKRRKEI